MRSRSRIIGTFAVVGLALVATIAPSAQAAVPSAPLPTVMAAAGDSITRGYDAASGCLLTDCPQYSWATGTVASVNSQLSRVLAAPKAATALNVAKTGAKMIDLDGQLTTAAAGNADYVTILLGANDLCTPTVATMTPVATFTSQFQTAMTKFTTAKPNSYVYVSSIPNITTLYTLFSTNLGAKLVWGTGKVCQSMLSSTGTAAQRAQVAAQETAFNNALKTVCATFSHCLYDNGATYAVKFVAADVSTIDYFHPSPAGQAKLAAATWTSGYWPTTA